MLQAISGLPDHVFGVRATGEVTKEDVETVLIPGLDELVARTGKIYYLLVLDTDVKNWDFGAWLSDAKAGIKHLTKWTKIAVVTPQDGVQKFTDIFSKFSPGEARGYRPDQLEEAKAWLAVQEEGAAAKA